MKDIPIFTGKFGIATLILREIPYKKCAYVMVRSAQQGRLPEFSEECTQFCQIAGAERVLITADDPIDFLPHVHDMLEFCCRREALPVLENPVPLEPVTEETGGLYLQYYNMLFHDIPNAATYTPEDLKRVMEKGCAYLALVNGETAGIGELGTGELCAIGVLPAYRGLGKQLALTLLERIGDKEIILRVSSGNLPALRLYKKLGFRQSRILSRWYEGTEITRE